MILGTSWGKSRGECSLWLSFAGVPSNHQLPDLLMQLIEYFFVLSRLMKVNAEADIRPAEVLMAQLLARLGEIKTEDGPVRGKD
jgi:hypothetical protein